MAIPTEQSPLSFSARTTSTAGAVAIRLGIHAGIGALGSLCFSAVSPLGGAIYAVSSAIAGVTISWICDKMECSANSQVARVGKAVAVFFGSIVAGIAAAALMGFSIPFAAGLLITLLPAVLFPLVKLISESVEARFSAQQCVNA